MKAKEAAGLTILVIAVVVQGLIVWVGIHFILKFW